MNLGDQPLANSLLKNPEDAEEKYPLTLVFCPKCSLVQIKETIKPEIMFKNYLYFSSVSQAILDNAKDAMIQALHRKPLNGSSLVVEIASNDGYLLKNYAYDGYRVLGIDPAENIAKKANEDGIPTECDFFSSRLADKLLDETNGADIIHANNVLAHVANTNDFVCGLADLLKRDGLAVIEVPYLGKMIQNREFDTVYHEHLCYFSLESLTELFWRHGLYVQDLQHLPIHGGTLRLFVRKAIFPTSVTDAVTDMHQEEERLGIRDYAYYENFANNCNSMVRTLQDLLASLRIADRSVIGYGASAKGSTLLNYANIGKYLDYVVDKSPHKQGLYTPGTHLQIYHPSMLTIGHPHYALLLTWNFKGEISRENERYLKSGGRFICPIPHVEIIDRPLSKNLI
jgi:SAM-dependent methyltransferase